MFQMCSLLATPRGCRCRSRASFSLLPMCRKFVSARRTTFFCVAAILAEYSENCFLVYILRSAEPMLGMKGERFAQLPLAIPHGVEIFYENYFDFLDEINMKI